MGMPANASSEKPPSKSDRNSGTPGRTTGPLAPRRGRLFQLLWPITSYVVTNVTVTPILVAFLRPEPDRGHRPPARGRGVQHAPPLKSPVDARQLLGRPSGVLSQVLA